MKQTTKLMAAFLAVMMLLTLALPMSFAEGKSASATRNGLRVMVISDTHYILERMIKDTADYRHAVNLDQKVYNESEAIVNEQLEKVRQAKPEVLLLNGDLTKDGEYLGHKVFAEKLRQLKKDVPGMKVYVTNGNHDINNSDAQEFNTKDGKAVPAKKTSQKDFLKLYKDITWDDATVREVYTPPAGAEAGATSYMARPKKGYTLIVIDSNCYTADNTKDGTAEHEIRGHISEDLLQWAARKARNARERGDTVIGMMHHGAVAHFSQEQTIVGEFLVDDYQHIATTLADAGMHYLFTGHFHSQDVSVMTTKKGNTIYDIETGSSITYPCPMRAVQFTRSGSAKTDNGVKETLKGQTIQNIAISHKDPQTLKWTNISDMTAYSKTKALRSEVITTVIKDRLEKAIGSYPGAIDVAVDKLIPDLADMPVTADGKHGLLDMVNYAHQKHLAGVDHGSDPTWYMEARRNVEDGKLLASLVDVLSRDLAVLTGQGVNKLAKTDLVKGPAVDALYHGLFGAAHVSYYAVPKLANDFNQFLALTLDSLTQDKNFPDDVTFTITGANALHPGEPDLSSVENGIPSTNVVQKLLAALLGNG